jgi:HSP20 family molecular chaperone IbpA
VIRVTAMRNGKDENTAQKENPNMAEVSIQRAPTPNAFTHSLSDYMNSLCKKISERAFALFERNGKRHGHALDDWFKAESEFLMPVPVEVFETDNEISVRAKVPGFEEKDLEIVAEPRQLFITGKTEKKVEEKKKKTLYSEISASEIFRRVTLPSEIDPEKATADLKNGVLEISMPKAGTAKKSFAIAKAA